MMFYGIPTDIGNIVAHFQSFPRSVVYPRAVNSHIECDLHHGSRLFVPRDQMPGIPIQMSSPFRVVYYYRSSNMHT